MKLLPLLHAIVVACAPFRPTDANINPDVCNTAGAKGLQPEFQLFPSLQWQIVGGILLYILVNIRTLYAPTTLGHAKQKLSLNLPASRGSR